MKEETRVQQAQASSLSRCIHTRQFRLHVAVCLGHSSIHYIPYLLDIQVKKHSETVKLIVLLEQTKTVPVNFACCVWSLPQRLALAV